MSEESPCVGLYIQDVRPWHRALEPPTGGVEQMLLDIISGRTAQSSSTSADDDYAGILCLPTLGVTIIPNYCVVSQQPIWLQTQPAGDVALYRCRMIHSGRQRDVVTFDAKTVSARDAEHVYTCNQFPQK